MSEAPATGVSTAELLRESWRMLRGHARLFVMLLGVPILAQVVASVLVVVFVFPMQPGKPLREVWLAMDTWRKFAITVLFFAVLAVIYRALAASVFAAAEIRSGRNAGVWQALRQVRRKQLRLFWLLLLVSCLAIPTGRVAPVIVLGFAFFCAPAFPAAILENLGAIKALERGGRLAKDGQGRLALLFLLYLVLVAAGAYLFIAVLTRVQDLVGNPWYTRPLPLLGLWAILLVPQWYMVALTLNYFDQRLRKGESAEVTPTQVLEPYRS